MATVLVLLLLAMMAVGLVSLSTIEIRKADYTRDQQTARANARLGLMMAIGQLQEHLGPDQRVSAPSSILEKNSSVTHPHWVGVWRTTKEDGSSYWERDDLLGGLKDLRWSEGWDAEEEALSYLVSGNEGGRERARNFVDPYEPRELNESWVDLVGEGSLGVEIDLTRGRVSVPKVPVTDAENNEGSYGYWVGDLGVRANVAIPNAWAESEEGDDPNQEEALFSVMASQEVDASVMQARAGLEGQFFTNEEREKMVTSGQVDLVADSEWSPRLWHQLTTWSQGVLTDTRQGGLRKDLTPFFGEDELSEEDGEVEEQVVLSSRDNLVGPRNEAHAEVLGQDWALGRYRESSPTFGMLRDWARNAASLETIPREQRDGDTIVVDGEEAGARAAFANDKAVSLKSRSRSDLKPIVVEGSMYSSFSYHPNPSDFQKRFNIRFHQWPRVVLWNPYNVPIQMPRSVMMMQLNSRNDFRTTVRSDSFFGWVQWISWGGGTRTPPPQSGESITESENYNDPYSGMRYYSLPEQEIGPGECLFFSPAAAVEYDSRNILNNELSAKVVPDPARNFYISSTEFDDDDTGSGFDFEIIDYFYFPAGGLNNQADDSRMIWKDATGFSEASILDFDKMTQLQLVSCSLQYGAGKEPRVAWSELNPIPVEFTELTEPVIANKPDVRSREGFRLRWLEEHSSNTGVLNSPAGSHVFETAPLANWNLRAGYALRSPWANIAGDIGDGLASGPWFFGAYTRDLYDQLVGWDEQLPFFEEGYYRGNPFGPPQEGQLRNVLFDVPREETGLLSLAQLQHAKLSEFIWHPTYAAGNSLIDPRLGIEGMAGTAPLLEDEELGGWNKDAAGWAASVERSEDQKEWARFARFMMQDLPEEENLVYDLSYEVNHTLWDEFFLSSGTQKQRKDFVEEGSPLPNGRMRLIGEGSLEELNKVDSSASQLMLEGAFNVNSTNVEAWKALLSSTRQSEFMDAVHVPFPRSPQPQGGEMSLDSSLADDEEAWAGFRSLRDEEVEALAEEIVEQVKLRGPFLSLSDFVNRRLTTNEEGDDFALMGPLQAAIGSAGLNQIFEDRWGLDRSEGDLLDYTHPDHIADATRLDHTLKPESKAWGAPGYLTQADLLQVIGPVLSARTDTFLVRSYGEAVNRAGQVTAKAWCEAVVQRTPKPVVADETGLNPDFDQVGGKWGRRFKIRSFRWLSEEEV